ncbi:hypothetical protein MTO96_045493 [Rhipicephalus appendiculatus]
MFVYYEDLDGEECDCSRSSHAQDESGPGCHASGSSDGGRQHADDGEPERERFSSSSNSFYESAIEKQSEEGNRGLKDTSCQVLIHPPCYSQGLQAVQETSDAEAQTEELDTSQFAGLQSTLEGRDADVTQRKERLENVQHYQVSGAQQPRLKTEELLTRPQAATPQYVVRLRYRTATREQKPVDKNRADDEVHPPQPRPPLRQRNLPPRRRPGNGFLTLPVETKTPATDTG